MKANKLTKILLINPATKTDRVEIEGKFKGSDIFRYPKLGTLIVSALTPPDFEVEIIDEIVEKIPWNTEAELIGISAVTALAPRAYEIAAKFHRQGKTIIMGGCHATFLPDEALNHVDSVLIGQAEDTWPQILSDYQTGRLRPRYYSKANPINFNPPFADRKFENKPGYASGHVFSILRGCSKRCSFCTIHNFFAREIYRRPITEAIAEAESLPSKIINLVDDNLFSDPEYTYNFFRNVKSLKKHWLFQASIDIVRDKRLMKTLQQAGAKGVFIGIESVNSPSIMAVNKLHNLNLDYREVVKLFHDHGIVVEAGMMFGFDYDEPDVFKRTLDYLNEINLDLVQIGAVCPMPGTNLFDRLSREGRILTYDWSQYDCKKVVIQPNRMSPRELEQGLDYLRKNFYSLKSIARRGRKNILKLGPVAGLGYFLRGNFGFRTNHLQGLDYPP